MIRMAVEQETPGAEAEETDSSSVLVVTTRPERGARVTTACIVCGTAFEVKASWLNHGYGKTCSDACRTTWRLQRGRGRDGQPWEQVAERLWALGPTVLDELKPPAPEIVRRFYGLVDGTPWTQAAIAEHLGLRKTRVQQILHSAAVRRVLGERAHRQDRKTVIVACAACGASVERTPRELSERAQTTCGPTCLGEFRQQQVSRIASDATIRSKRLERLRDKTSSPEFAENVRQRALRRARPYDETLRALPAWRDAWHASRRARPRRRLPAWRDAWHASRRARPRRRLKRNG